MNNDLVNIIAQYEKYPFKFSTLCRNESLQDYINQSETIDWKLISKYRLPESFIIKYYDKLDKFYVSCQELSDCFIKEKIEDLNRTMISAKQKLSEEMIEYLYVNHPKKLSWDQISIHQNLSIPFIEKYAHKLDTTEIQKRYNFPDEFWNEIYYQYKLKNSPHLSQSFLSQTYTWLSELFSYYWTV